MINRLENWIAELPCDVRALFDACAVERTFRTGDEICRIGSPAQGVHQVIEGYIKVTGVTASGDTAMVVIYGPGNCWGESPIISERPHHHTTTAMTPTRLRIIPRSDFLRIYAGHPAVSYALCRKFSSSMSRLLLSRETQTSERMGRLVATSFLSFVRDLPGNGNACEIDVPLTQTDVANYLGVTRQSVQPEVAALKGAGILEKRSGTWHIHDIQRLRRCAIEQDLN